MFGKIEHWAVLVIVVLVAVKLVRHFMRPKERTTHPGGDAEYIPYQYSY